MQHTIGNQFESKGKTFQVTSVEPVDPANTRTIEKMNASNKAPFYFSAAVVLKSGELSEKQGGIFLRFNSGDFISLL